MSLPVPRAGRRRWHSRKNRAGRPNGVLSASRILPHRYADEGDTGRWFRRILRRREERAWVREFKEES